jgi:site-specific recombinase XerD
MSSIYKNGEWWYYQTVLTLPDGSKRKIQTSLKTKDRKEGRRRQKDLDSKYLIDQIHLSSRVSLEETVDQFLVHRTKVCSHGDITQNTLRSDKGSLKVFLGFLTTRGVTYLNEFSDEDRGREIVEEFIDQRRSQKVSPNTIRRDLRHVSGFFKYCVQAPRRYLSRNPISSVSLPKASRKSRFPEQKDWETLRTYLRKQSKSPKVSLIEEILWFQIETGCRIGEILRLKWTREKTDLVGVGESWSVVEDNGSRLRLYSKKRERVIPLKELGEGRLTKHLQQKKRKGNLTTYVFPSPVTDLPLNISQFSRSFRRVLDTLKIQKTFGTHGVRHGFISYLINNGVTSDQIGWLVGHSSSEITAIYSHVDEKTLGSVLAKLG